MISIGVFVERYFKFSKNRKTKKKKTFQPPFFFFFVFTSFVKMSGAAALQKDRNFIAVIGDEVKLALILMLMYKLN